MLPSLLFALTLAPAHAAPSWPDLTTAPAGAARDGANDVALIIGIEDYVIPGVPDVPGARDNAAAWRGYLKDVRGVPVVKVLTDAAASREGMLEAAAAVRARVKPGGRVWLVYIGHGAPSRERDEGLLVGADAQQSATSLYARSLPQSVLLRALGAEEGVPVVAVLDACFSGATPGGRLVEGLQPLLPMSALRTAAPSVTLLSAGRAEQFAGPLPGLGRPAFSWLVLGAMRGWGDDDANGVVTAQEAVDWSTDRLVELVNDRTQEPQVSGPAGVALGKGREKAPALEALAEAGGPAKPAPAPTPGPTPAPNVRGGGSGGGEVDSDVAALQRLKSLRATREAKLDELAKAKSAEGDAAWGKLSGVLSDGSPEEVAVVERFVKTWEGAKVWVEDAEGKHERAVTVAAVDAARTWLGRVGTPGREWVSPSLGTMKWIPAGTFLMGSREDEPHRRAQEVQHKVTLTKGYWMMEHEVTQGEWHALMGSNPVSRPEGECDRWGQEARPAQNEPVYCVSWNEVVEFAKRAGARDGVAYTLPTEAQWEYAARGGGVGVYAGGNEVGAVAWVDHEWKGSQSILMSLSDEPKAPEYVETHPGCLKTRNGFGLCDMSGNVWEWTADFYADYHVDAVLDPTGPASGDWRVSRGGAWTDDSRGARVAGRGPMEPGQRTVNTGFRLVRNTPPTK